MSVCFGIGCGTLCRGGCSGTVMRFSTCDARLRNSAIHVAYSREPQSMRHMRPRFHNPCGIYGRVSVIYIMQQYILQKYTKFRSIYFGSVSNCRYRSIQAQVSIFPHSTIAALYKKGPGVCRGARPCAPLRFPFSQKNSPYISKM